MAFCPSVTTRGFPDFVPPVITSRPICFAATANVTVPRSRSTFRQLSAAAFRQIGEESLHIAPTQFRQTDPTEARLQIIINEAPIMDVSDGRNLRLRDRKPAVEPFSSGYFGRVGPIAFIDSNEPFS